MARWKCGMVGVLLERRPDGQMEVVGVLPDRPDGQMEVAGVLLEGRPDGILRFIV